MSGKRNAITGKRETRAKGSIELRAAGDAAGSKLGGYAAVFNSETVIGDYFREKIAPGAFAAAVARDDVRALFNHDPNFVLGRNKNNTLTLAEDATGLKFECTPPDAAWAKDLMASVERGDISQCSFGFLVTKEQWEESEGALPLRTILECELFDVSVVTFPAYDDTSVAVRSLDDWRGAHAQPPKKNSVPAIGAKLRMQQGLRERGLTVK